MSDWDEGLIQAIAFAVFVQKANRPIESVWCKKYNEYSHEAANQAAPPNKLNPKNCWHKNKDGDNDDIVGRLYFMYLDDHNECRYGFMIKADNVNPIR